MKALLRHCLHIVRARRTFDAMPDDDGRMLVAFTLPTTVRQHPDTGLHLKQSFLVTFGRKTKSPWPGIGCDSLSVTVAEQRMRPKRFAGEGPPGPIQEHPSLFEFLRCVLRLRFITHIIYCSILELDNYVRIQI